MFPRSRWCVCITTTARQPTYISHRHILDSNQKIEKPLHTTHLINVSKSQNYCDTSWGGGRRRRRIFLFFLLCTPPRALGNERHFHSIPPPPPRHPHALARNTYAPRSVSHVRSAIEGSRTCREMTATAATAAAASSAVAAAASARIERGRQPWAGRG